MIKIFVALALSLVANTATAGVHCSTNCADYAEYKYACGIRSGWPPTVRTCSGINYAKKSTCEVQRLTMGCSSPFEGIDKEFAGRMIRDLGLATRSERDGWNRANCASITGALAVTFVSVESAAMCTFAAAGGTPLLGAACVSTAAGFAGSIAAATCIQLCHDRHLLDCR